MTVALLAVLVFSAGALAEYVQDLAAERIAGEQAREAALSAAAELPEEPDPPLAPAPAEETDPEPQQEPLAENAQHLLAVDLAALREVNPEVVGWISIPGTKLDYPVLQAGDNRYYLTHSWQKKENTAGSVFMEATAAADFGGYHTLLYGHNMKSGSMFGTLRKYRTQSHYEENPLIYIVTDTGVRRYEIFAAFEASVKGWTYRMDLDTAEKKAAFLEYGLERSKLETDLRPAADEQILTLSTCTGGDDVRWVVQGVLTGLFTSEPAAPEAAR